MTKQQVITKKQTVEKLVKKITDGVYAVKSQRYEQLWYTVKFDPTTNTIGCPCKGWKYGKGQLCRHMYTVMEFLET